MHYRIFRLRESLRGAFRIATHTSGHSLLKPKEYEAEDSVEAPNAYAAWKLLQTTTRPLLVGDVLQSDSGKLEVFKFVGFEPAEWILPEVKLPAIPVEPEASSSAQ